jgi:hypothetical protein
MKPSPLLAILGAIGCKSFEGEACLEPNEDNTCPSQEEANSLLKGPACSTIIVSVDGEGELTEDSGFELCCYPTTERDNKRTKCIEGRPLMGESGPVLAEVLENKSWTEVSATPLLPPEILKTLAYAWTQAARNEHASVAAFARLTLDLLALSAPPELLISVQQAAADEVRHAKGCFALASRFAGKALAPGPLSVPVSVAPTHAALLKSTIVEGCIGETLSAVLAEAALKQAGDTEVKKVLRQLVRDEEKHAVLSWKIVSWLLQEKPELSGLAAEVFEEALATVYASVYVDDSPVYAVFGRLGPEATQAALQSGVEGLIKPCARQLLLAA